jgi:hypothetical protein
MSEYQIAEAYAMYATQKAFQKELKEFMAGHMQRKALIQRLVKAGILEGSIKDEHAKPKKGKGARRIG